MAKVKMLLKQAIDDLGNQVNNGSTDSAQDVWGSEGRQTMEWSLVQDENGAVYKCNAVLKPSMYALD